MANTTKYTDEMVAEALAMRARGEKQVVIHATFGGGIESAIRRLRERDNGPALLVQVQALCGKVLRRKKDGSTYRIFQASGRQMGGLSAAYLVPVWRGKCHWKTHERLVQDYEVVP